MCTFPKILNMHCFNREEMEANDLFEMEAHKISSFISWTLKKRKVIAMVNY